jgi:hypothetical protein
MFKRFACLALIGLSAMGCSKETTSSKNIKTGGIAALIDVYADTGSTATVHVELRVGGSSSNTYINLDGKDELTATAGKQTLTLEPRDTGIFEAIFSGVGEDTEFSVKLDRPDDVTADDSSGTLPAPFDLDDPTSDLSRETDDLELTWAPGSDNDRMDLEIDGDCIFDFSKDKIADNGSYTVSAGDLKSTGGSKPEACRLDLTAERTRNGSADSKFDPESYFKLHQRRGARFDSNP